MRFNITLIFIVKMVMGKIKKLYDTVKKWVTDNGIKGEVVLILGVILWVLGCKVCSGFAFGVFSTVNWGLLKRWVMIRVKKVKKAIDNYNKMIIKYNKAVNKIKKNRKPF